MDNLVEVFGAQNLDHVRALFCGSPGFGIADLNQLLRAAVDGGMVHVDNLLALLAVGFDHHFLHILDGVHLGDHAGQLEEGGLPVSYTHLAWPC